jgi:N-acetylglucosaminyldiphosphoundecaprenol N-acetyl-beta-D-mannosaminyltransferase
MKKNRVRVMGCEIDNLSMQETLDEIERMVNSDEYHQHVVVNVDKIVKANRNPELKHVINSCSLINVDGMPVVWASRILGKPLKERVTGIDLFCNLIELSEKRRWRVFLLGAQEEVVRIVVAVLKDKYPLLNIVGYRNGYWSDDEEQSIVEFVRDKKPDLLFVAISSPKKERFLGLYQPFMKVPFSMGVGGTFDVVAGITKRAPRWMQKMGLEWLYRFFQEPRRMFRRYFVEDIYFFWLLAKELNKLISQRK